MRGLPADRRFVDSPPALHGLRARGLLRQLEEQARHRPFLTRRTSDHSVIRAGRGLGLVLHRRDRSRRVRVARQRACRTQPVLADSSIAWQLAEAIDWAL